MLNTANSLICRLLVSEKNYNMHSIERTLARVISILFHPLIMTTLGMLIIFNSGTAFSAVQPEVKRVSLVVMALFTSVFPAALIIILYLTGAIKDVELTSRKERLLPVSLTIILYMFTFFVVRSIPQLTSGHVVFLFCPPVALFIALVLSNFMMPSIHMLGTGMLAGVVLSLMIYYGAQVQMIFLIIIMVSGFVGSARLILKIHTPLEVLAGFAAGFISSAGIMTIYAF